MSIQSIRDGSKGVMAKVIVGFIIFTFALFGVDAIVGNSSGGNEAASVNGTEISSVQLERSTELLRRQVADPSVSEDVLKQQALSNLIGRQLLAQDAESLNLHVADNRVDSEILRTPEFQSEGAFDEVLFEIVLRNNGQTPLDYRNQLASALLFQQQRLGISGSAFLTKPELETLLRIGEQTRDLGYLTIKAAALGESLSFSTQEMNAFYTANIDQYTTEESLNVEYLELKIEDFYDQVDVEDLEVQQRYQQELENAGDSEERRAAHILITAGDDQSKAEARAELEGIQQQLQGGADFAELATAHSDDPGSAQSGGDLGFNEQGVFVPEFEEALYQLAEGEVSDIVETGFGVHLIKLTEVRTQEPPSLGERKDALELEIRHGKAEQLFVAAAEELQNDTFSAGDLAEPAENAGLEVQTSRFFSRQGGSAGIIANASVVKTAFSDDVLQDSINSDVVEITRDHIVVLRVKEHRPASPMAFDTVADQITAALVATASRSKAQELGQQLLADLRSGKAAGDVASESGYEWVKVDKVARAQTDLDAQLVQTLFKMPKSGDGKQTFTGVTRTDGDYVVMSLVAVNVPEDNTMAPQQRSAAQQAISSQLGARDFTEYQRSLQEEADIVKY